MFLNHRPDEATPHKDHQPPRGLKIRSNRRAHGEDDPLYSDRLTRDGWQVLDEWEVDFLGLPEFYKTIQPQRRTRPHPNVGLAIELTRHLDGLKYRERFTVTGAGQSAPNLEHADWVDWDQRGRLIVLRDGRLAVANVHEGRVGALRELVDLTPDRPELRQTGHGDGRQASRLGGDRR